MTRSESHEAEWDMTAASPWSVKGIDPKAREMAKDLARRSGMTLGEWLNQIITDGEMDAPGSDTSYVGYRGIPSRDYVAPEVAPPSGVALARGGELQRITRALDQLSTRIEAAERRSTLAISGIDQSVMGVLSRLEAVERDQGAVAARFDGALDDVRQEHARSAEKMRRMADEEAPRLEAMKALEGALGKVAEKLYEGEGKTRGALNELREDLSNLARRLDRTDAKIEAEPELIEDVIGRISARLEQAEAGTSGAVMALEQSFSDLDARLRASEARAAGPGDGKLERLAAELSDKVAAARAEMADRLKDAAGGKLDSMEQALRDLAGHVEQGERRSAQAIDRMGREVTRIASTLSERVSKVEAQNAEAAQHMNGEMARMTDAMEKRLARQDTAQAQALEKLGGEITRIAEKLAERIANSERRATQTIEDVGEQLSRVTERLNQRYDRAQSELADRIQQSETRTVKLLDEAREKFDLRLADTHRRAALEAAQEAARQAALAEEPVYASHTNASDFPGPFAPALEAAPLVTSDPFAEPDNFAPAAAPEPVVTDPFAATMIEADPFDAASRPLPSESFRPEPFAADAFAAEPVAPAPSDAFSPSLFDESGAFEAGSPPPPRSTREMLEQARAAMRVGADKPEPRGRRDGQPLPGAVPVPPFEGEPSKLFGFSLPKRKKKEGVTLRTALVASGTAAALAVTGAGAVLLINAESGTQPGDHGGDHFGVAPTEVADTEASTAVAPTIAAPAAAQMAVALTPPPGQIEGLKTAAAATTPTFAPQPAMIRPSAEVPADVRALYSSAVRRIESDDAGGVSDLKKAANLGHAPAQFYLAKLYETGGAGLKKNLTEARRWTERAADNGDVSAMHNLGLYYYEGEAGEQDPAKAARWFQRAASQGVKDSQYNLAMLYAKGYGVAKNPADAYKWYLIAATAGDEGAKSAAQAIRPQLTPEAQAAAEHAAAAFHAQTQGLLRTASANP